MRNKSRGNKLGRIISYCLLVATLAGAVGCGKEKLADIHPAQSGGGGGSKPPETPVGPEDE